METRTIEKALALTGKTMDDVNKYRPVIWAGYWDYDIVFSIEKFWYYLLSESFIEKYMPLLFPFEITGDYEWYLQHTAKDFWEAIYEYQKNNEQPLISLLEKIW